MNVKKLKKELEQCDGESEIIIFVKSENNVYRPFKNIEMNIFNKDSFNESIHLDVSIYKEYKNIHFPNNLKKEDVELLVEKRDMLLEELKEIEEELGEFK